MTEDSALIATLEGGALDVRFLSRRAKVGGGASGVGVMAPVAAEPLPVPKKTKLYIEFAKRERENAQSLYHAFQQCGFGHLFVLDSSLKQLESSLQQLEACLAQQLAMAALIMAMCSVES